MHRLVLVVCLTFAAVSAVAQGIGTLPSNATGSFTGAPLTIVDLGQRASSTGTATTATVQWAGGPCTGAFKVKVLRLGTQYTSYTTVAERGPFDVPGSGYVTVSLAPAFEFKPGDLLAITQLRNSTECGGVMYAGEAPEHTIIFLTGDSAPSGPLSGFYLMGESVAATISTAQEEVVAVIPVAGSVAGSNNSFFRTSLQLTNPQNVAISGKLVFHRAGASAAPGDRSLAYTLAANSTASYADVVASLSASGLGSIDIVPTRSAAPIATARVFNDLGTAGSLGFTESSLGTDMVLTLNQTGSFQTPADLVNFRMNVGVRTLDRAAQIFITHYSATGAVLNSYLKSYPANYFEQVSLAAFAGVTPAAGGSVKVTVSSGSLFVYASSTDNRTNDTAATFVLRP